MILLDVVLNLEPQKSFIEEIAPEAAAAFIAFTLGASANWYIGKTQRNRIEVKEQKDLLSRFHLATEKYFLARIEKELVVELIELTKVRITFSVNQEKENNKRVQHELTLREQDVQLRCNEFHAEMRSFGSMLLSGENQSEEKIELLSLINRYAQPYIFDFSKWMNVHVFINEEEAMKYRKGYNCFVNSRLNMDLKAIQEFLQSTLPKNLSK